MLYFIVYHVITVVPLSGLEVAMYECVCIYTEENDTQRYVYRLVECVYTSSLFRSSIEDYVNYTGV